jgi:hypothetical protein
MDTSVESTASQQPVIKAYKGFDKNMQCRGYQYKVGESYEHQGKVKACEGGFHSCEYPLDVFKYYEPASAEFAEVEAAGEISKHGDDTKVSSSKLTVKASIGLPGLISAAIEYTMARIKTNGTTSNSGSDGAASNSGSYGAASNSGEYGAASNSGDNGAASNSGYKGAASNSGEYGAASNSGDNGAASNSGYKGATSNSGDAGAASNSGIQGAASNSGEYGAASNSGSYGAASNSGTRGAASNSGHQGAASNSGLQGAASNSGSYGAASNSGSDGIAAAFGYEGKSKSTESGAIVCVYRDDEGKLVHIKASKVGDNGIKADTWYMLDSDGEFVDCRNTEKLEAGL